MPDALLECSRAEDMLKIFRQNMNRDVSVSQARAKCTEKCPFE